MNELATFLIFLAVHVETPKPKGLISLEQWERENAPSVTIITERRNGIACPKCGNELWDDCTRIITTLPARVPTFCKSCKYTGSHSE